MYPQMTITIFPSATERKATLNQALQATAWISKCLIGYMLQYSMFKSSRFSTEIIRLMRDNAYSWISVCLRQLRRRLGRWVQHDILDWNPYGLLVKTKSAGLACVGRSGSERVYSHPEIIKYGCVMNIVFLLSVVKSINT